MKDLNGKVAVITGGAAGLGLAMAKRFADEGMKLVLADIEDDVLASTVSEFADGGAEAKGVHCDVTDLAEVEALRDAALDAFGAVHVICNNAGVAAGGPAWAIPVEVWRWVLDVNFFGVIHGIHTFVPLLIEQGEGHVVNTASAAGLVSTPGIGPYNASKHAVVTLSETLQHDLAMVGANVGVSVLCPAFVRTRIHESDRNAPAEVEAALSGFEEWQAGSELFKAFVEGGIEPSIIGDAVTEAVLEERFYILTHPEVGPWLQTRVETILGGGSPTMPLP